MKTYFAGIIPGLAWLYVPIILLPTLVLSLVVYSTILKLRKNHKSKPKYLFWKSLGISLIAVVISYNVFVGVNNSKENEHEKRSNVCFYSGYTEGADKNGNCIGVYNPDFNHPDYNHGE